MSRLTKVVSPTTVRYGGFERYQNNAAENLGQGELDSGPFPVAELDAASRVPSIRGYSRRREAGADGGVREPEQSHIRRDRGSVRGVGLDHRTRSDGRGRPVSFPHVRPDMTGYGDPTSQHR